MILLVKLLEQGENNEETRYKWNKENKGKVAQGMEPVCPVPASVTAQGPLLEDTGSVHLRSPCKPIRWAWEAGVPQLDVSVQGNSG